MPRKDALLVLVCFSLLWAAVSFPILSSPLGSYPVVDASWHYSWAESVSTGNLFIYAPYFRAPLYPLVLGGLFALSGPSVLSGALLSFVFSAATVHLVQRIVLGMAGRTASLAAAALTGINGIFLFYGSALLITPLYTFLLVLSFYLFNRAVPSKWAWLALGAAAVARPSALLLFPLCIVLYRRVMLRSAWIFLVPVLAVWAVNWVNGDPGTVISSQGGINLYIGSGPEGDGYTAFAPSSEAAASFTVDSLPYTDNVWSASVAGAESDSSPSEISSYWTGLALDHVFNHPEHTASLLLRKMVLLLSPVAVPSNYDVYYFSRYSPVLGVLAGTPAFPVAGLILWMAIPGAAAAGVLKRRELVSLLWVLTLAAGILPFFVTARFVLPSLPFIVILLVPRILRTPGRSLALAVPGLLAGLVLAGFTAGTVRAGGVNMAFHDGLAHCRAGMTERGEILFLEAVETAMNRTDGIDLNGTDALYNLGVIAAVRADAENAESWFRAALERDPDHHAAREALAGLTGGAD